MGRIATSVMLLAMLAVPAFAATVQIAPLPPYPTAEPQLEFREERPATSPWISHPNNVHSAYLAGTARVEGMTGEKVLAIAALPGAKGRGDMGQNNFALDNWRGQRIRLSARLKSEDVERLQMWLRLIGPEPSQQLYYDMADRPVRGTTDWRIYEIVMDAPQDLRLMNYGFFIEGGKGRAFADAVRVEVVGPGVPAVALADIRADGWQRNQQLLDRIATNRKAQQTQAVAQWRAREQAQQREQFLNRPTPWVGSCSQWSCQPAHGAGP